jgi:carbonic anhydrase/acetyltransferase-like protein (isoleucine patch superfamily)
MKYEFTGESKVEAGVTLKRIRALISFGDVLKGDVGGWIEAESNLSQVYGNAWVSGDAKVSGNAWVHDDAQVSGYAQVSGDAKVSGNAQVSGYARMYVDALVSGYAQVSGYALVYGNAWVHGDAQVSGNALVYGNAWVHGDAQVSGDVDLLVVGPIGSRRAYLTVTADTKIGIRFTTGCFSGSKKELQAKLKGGYSARTLWGKQYRAAIAMADVCVKAKKK